MENLKQLLFMLGMLFASQHLFGQIPAIDSLKIIPDNPVTNDDVKVVCYTTFPSGDCDLISHSFDIQGGNIVLDLNYTVGSATYICHSADTLSIGYLNAGDYELEVNLKIDQQTAVFDTDIIHFSIENYLGISAAVNDFELSVYPNPFQNELSIEMSSIIEKVEIFSVLGEKIKSIEKIEKHQKINVSDLKNGIYLIVLTDDKGTRYSKRGLKNAL